MHERYISRVESLRRKATINTFSCRRGSVSSAARAISVTISRHIVYFEMGMCYRRARLTEFSHYEFE